VTKEPNVSSSLANKIHILAQIGGIDGFPLGIPNTMQYH
jgi:hypothetical protein